MPKNRDVQIQRQMQSGGFSSAAKARNADEQRAMEAKRQEMSRATADAARNITSRIGAPRSGVNTRNAAPRKNKRPAGR